MQRPLLQAFPSASTLGEVALHLPSLAGLFIYRSCGKCPFPTLQWNPPHNTVTSFPPPRLLGGATTPSFSSQLIYLQFQEGLPLPTPQWSGRPTLFATCLFVFVVLYSDFFLFFSLGGVSLSRGLCWSDQGCLCRYRMPVSSPCGLCLSSW
jgi:hypothetical protein